MWKTQTTWITGFFSGLLACVTISRRSMFQLGPYVYLYVLEETEQKKINRKFPATHKSKREETDKLSTIQLHLNCGICFLLRCCQYLDLLDHVAQLHQKLLSFFGPVRQPVQCLGELALQKKKKTMELSSYEVATRLHRAVWT